MTGAGPLEVQQPRARDKAPRADERVVFTSAILPPHLRTTIPIESTFSTSRLRHRRTKGSGSRKAGLTMMFKLAQSASRRWRRLSAHHQIVLVLEGRIFTDGVLQNAA